MYNYQGEEKGGWSGGQGKLKWSKGTNFQL